jgi:hypothetical protein
MVFGTYPAIHAVESSILWERSFRACTDIFLLEESVDSDFGSFTMFEVTGGAPGAPSMPAFTRALYKLAIPLTAGKAGTPAWLVGAEGIADTGCTGGSEGKDGFTSRVS